MDRLIANQKRATRQQNLKAHQHTLINTMPLINRAFLKEVDRTRRRTLIQYGKENQKKKKLQLRAQQSEGRGHHLLLLGDLFPQLARLPPQRVHFADPECRDPGEALLISTIAEHTSFSRPVSEPNNLSARGSGGECEIEGKMNRWTEEEEEENYDSSLAKPSFVPHFVVMNHSPGY